MKKLLLLVLIATQILSCKNKPANDKISTQPEIYPEENQPAEFKDFYREFFTSLIDGNAEQFNSFVNIKSGLVIIKSNGALPEFIQLRDIAAFRKSEGKSFFEFDRSKIGNEMIEEELPKVNCDKPEGYDKTGAFTQKVNSLKEEKTWEHAEMIPQQKEEISELASTVEYTVVNTDNYKYYFSLINGKWYVSFIDMRRPCQA
jgi:hypothetical protein